MRAQVTDTSRMAYHQLRDEKRLQPMQTKVLDALRSGAMTRKQLRDSTGMELSSVCGRVNSLLAAGLIELHGEAKDPETGKVQELVGLPRCSRSLFE